jgi:hypothetical protein
MLFTMHLGEEALLMLFWKIYHPTHTIIYMELYKESQLLYQSQEYYFQVFICQHSMSLLGGGKQVNKSKLI